MNVRGFAGNATAGGGQWLEVRAVEQPWLSSINRGNNDYADFADDADRSWRWTALRVAARGSIREIREIAVQLLGLTGRTTRDHCRNSRLGKNDRQVASTQQLPGCPAVGTRRAFTDHVDHDIR